MRWLVFLSISATFLQAREENCRVVGQVLSIAGVPLKRAIVRLQSGATTPNPATYTESSDNEGKFAFEDVKPGTYTLWAERTGYLGQWFGAKSPLWPAGAATLLVLAAGNEMKGLVLKLTPQVMIFGRVLDENDEPLSGFSVRAWHWTYASGKKQFQIAVDQGSQADGTFVLGGLAAGRYYLSAENQKDNFFQDGPEQFGRKGPRENNVRTYFPSILDPASAAPVDVTPGEDLRGIEIHVRRVRVFEIRGEVTNSSGSIHDGVLLRLYPKDRIDFGWDRRMAEPDKDGNFQFKNVTPGTYTIFADGGIRSKDPTGEFSKTEQLVARVEVTVTDKSIENLAVQLSAGLEIRGRFTTEGPAQIPAAKAPPAIRVQSIETGKGGDDFSESEGDGKFRIACILPRRVRFLVLGLPESAYVKSIKFGGVEVEGQDLDLTSGGEMEVVISPNGAEVGGTVRDADGKVVPSAVVQVCDKDGTIAKSTSTDQNGEFNLRGLAPGEYRVFSWEDRGDGIILDPDFRNSFERKTVAVKLVEKSRENVESVLIDKEAMEAEAKKIR